jgi:hypothetical protein
MNRREWFKKLPAILAIPAVGREVKAEPKTDDQYIATAYGELLPNPDKLHKELRILYEYRFGLREWNIERGLFADFPTFAALQRKAMELKSANSATIQYIDRFEVENFVVKLIGYR